MLLCLELDLVFYALLSWPALQSGCLLVWQLLYGDGAASNSLRKARVDDGDGDGDGW